MDLMILEPPSGCVNLFNTIHSIYPPSKRFETHYGHSDTLPGLKEALLDLHGNGPCKAILWGPYMARAGTFEVPFSLRVP